MKKIILNFVSRSSCTSFLTASLFVFSLSVSAGCAAPFTVSSGLFNQANTDTLGLCSPAGTETHTIFAPDGSGDKYSNGVVMTHFNGKFYCMWQSSAADEDASDTHVVYSTSSDGTTWSSPEVLAPAAASAYRSSGGWISSGTTLTAFVNEWPVSVSPRGGNAYCTTTTDGTTWSALTPVLMKDGSAMNGIIEQDPHTLSNGRIIGAAHFQSGLSVCPIYTDDATGTSGWVKGSFKPADSGSSTSVEMEPSLFVRKDGGIVMIFRDQNSSFYKYASLSTDNGVTWSSAVLTNMPDARTKQSAGNLPDGSAFMAGNPVTNKLRCPLAVTVSSDGLVFTRSYLLRSTSSCQTLRYSGTAKRQGFHYPKSFVYDGWLYVSYATNKEDAEYTKVPVSSIE